MATTLFKNARIFDGTSADCPEGMYVYVEGELIREVSEHPIRVAAAHTIDVRGRTLMPGLIDAHIHACVSDINFNKVDLAGECYRTAHAVRMLDFALRCGFTTVRDMGGGDYGLWRAIEDGLVRAPNFLYAGRALSMTGGHGDFRHGNQSAHTRDYCACGPSNSIAVIADGVDECVKAVREELRRGAHCIKIMASGGASSPSDPIWMNQYREDELRAIVNECAERRTYATAHCHPAAAIRRCVECGVRGIEHGTLIDDETARFVAARGAYVVPTMATIFAAIELGPQLGFPAQNLEKVRAIGDQAFAGMQAMRTAGVKVGFGTDLLGQCYTRQCTEFTIRSRIFSPLEILRQATSVNAEILLRSGSLGCVSPEARADLLVVDGDPLTDLSLLAADGRHLPVIMRGGELVKQEPGYGAP